MSMIRKRTKAYLWPVSYIDLTKEDLSWLDKAIEKDYHGNSAKGVLDDFVRGFCQVWRIETGGILVTEIHAFEKSSVLYVKYLAGKNVIRNLDKIDACLKIHAKENNAKSIECSAENKGIQRFYSKRYTEITRIYSMEV